MRCQVLSPFSQAFDVENFESVMVQTKEGILTILPGHEPLISALSPGLLIIREKGQARTFAIGGGILEVCPERVRLLVDMAETTKEKDIEVLRERKESIRKQINTYRSHHDTMDMDKLLQMEYEYLKESAREQLALS